LSNYEVKSAGAGGSYEYQYHKNTGVGKLIKDAKVGHLLFEHADNLRKVNLRYAHGTQMKAFFKKGSLIIPIHTFRGIAETSPLAGFKKMAYCL
jgi:hypothetical protein